LAATQQSLNTALTRLGSGFRVNSAMDDAAGLQIATRLDSQTQGLSQAQSNTANGISMLQTADGGLAEASNILLRMKDLATQSYTASSSPADQTALQSEYSALGTELNQIVTRTTFGGNFLFSSGTTSDGTGGALSASLTFQIGDKSADTMTVNTTTALTTLATDLAAVSVNYGTPASTAGAELTTAGGNTIIDTISTAISDLGALRSQIGAGANRLQHVSNNLTNMITNTTAAKGQIMDVDYAKETSISSSNQLLMQAGTAALKQANTMSQLVVSLLQ
jgi:flagellin